MPIVFFLLIIKSINWIKGVFYLPKSLKIYIDKNGKIIEDYEELNKVNNEIKEDFPVEKKRNNFFVRAFVILAAGQLASKTISPII